MRKNTNILPVTINDIRLRYHYYDGSCTCFCSGRKDRELDDYERNLYAFLTSLFYVIHNNDNEQMKPFGNETISVGEMRKHDNDSKNEAHFEFGLNRGDITVYFCPCNSLMSQIDTFYTADIMNYSAHLKNKDLFSVYDILEEHHRIAHERLVALRTKEYASVYSEMLKAQEIRDVYREELKKLGVSDDDIECIEFKWMDYCPTIDRNNNYGTWYSYNGGIPHTNLKYRTVKDDYFDL